MITDAVVKHMVNRFLGWRLPKPWNPDNGISYARPNYAHPPADHDWPVGTNLFSATDAEAMVRYMVEGIPTDRATTAQENGSASEGAPKIEVDLVCYKCGGTGRWADDVPGEYGPNDKCPVCGVHPTKPQGGAVSVVSDAMVLVPREPTAAIMWAMERARYGYEHGGGAGSYEALVYFDESIRTMRLGGEPDRAEFHAYRAAIAVAAATPAQSGQPVAVREVTIEDVRTMFGYVDKNAAADSHPHAIFLTALNSIHAVIAEEVPK